MEYNELVNAVVSDVIKETVVYANGHKYRFDSIPPEQAEEMAKKLHQEHINYTNLSDGEKANREAQLKKSFNGYVEGAKADKEYYANGGK